MVTPGLNASLAILAVRGAHAVPEHDRQGQDEARDREAGDRHRHGPRGESGGDADEERNDRDEQREIADALADRDEASDALAPGDDRIVAHHVTHPWVASTSSMAAGRSAIAYDTRARCTLASK